MTIGTDRVAVAGGTGVDGIDSALAVWGRLLRVEAAIEIENADVHAWKPDRSAVRTRLRRFRPVRDAAVRVLKLSEEVFWIGVVGDIDRDAYLVFESAGAGPMRVTTSQLRNEDAETPFVIHPLSSASLAGQVQGARGDDIASATVDLLQALSADAGRSEHLAPDTPLIVVATTASGPDGAFVFERVTQPPFLVVASSPAGRGSVAVDAIGPSIVVRLVPPVRARGRVLRNHLAVPSARIRFVPAVDAWMSGEDPSLQIAEESMTGDDGTFSMALPEKHAGGELVVVMTDGAMVRVPIPDASGLHDAEVALGDISIADPIRVIVRLLEPIQLPPCDIIAIGPIGRLGLSVVRAASPLNIYALDVPEPGQWTFSADCDGQSRAVAPLVATIPSDPGARVSTIDVRFAP